ncbi:MAG: LCP family protein, partial [Patescibacteria group bacterium]|nr:LCP family protein [Patescibacteria group bacterium]
MKNGYYINGIYYPAKKSKFLKFSIYFFIILLFSFSTFSWRIFSSYKNNKSGLPDQNGGIVNNIGQGIKNLITFKNITGGENKKLSGESEDRINILLLGMGGKGHSGPYLTDTLIIASIQPSTEKVALMSVPRDLYVPIEGSGWHKINHANAFGESKKTGYGTALAVETVEKIFDLPIHYYMRVDFDGFKNIVDDLGGLKIYIEKSFVDRQYPDNNFGYEPVSFIKGWEVMNGNRALKYARSRHGSNGENSDFARSERQQKVLLAAKEKILSYRFWLNPKKIGAVLSDLDTHIITDLKAWEIISLSNIAKKIKTEKIRNVILSNGNNGILYSTNINGSYALLPKNNDFTSLKILAKNMFNEGAVAGMSANDNITKATIEVQNGTKITGMASRVAKMLKQDNFIIDKIANSQNQNYKKTIIYDLSRGRRQKELKFLKNKLNAEVNFNIPNWLLSQPIANSKINLTNPIKSSADFLIILGKDA